MCVSLCRIVLSVDDGVNRAPMAEYISFHSNGISFKFHGIIPMHFHSSTLDSRWDSEEGCEEKGHKNDGVMHSRKLLLSRKQFSICSRTNGSGMRANWIQSIGGQERVGQWRVSADIQATLFEAQLMLYHYKLVNLDKPKLLLLLLNGGDPYEPQHSHTHKWENGQEK